MADGKPVLWHIPISHYSEKARWALAYKDVEHDRRAPQPPAHMLVALAYSRGKQKTFPVMEIDGRKICDSTDIIAALEERHPDPPLYPSEPAERARALELEDWFDEKLGPHARLLGWHEITRDPKFLRDIAGAQLPAPMKRLRGVGAVWAKTFVRVRYRVGSEDAAENARARIREGFDKLEAELGDGDYLVGDRFSVADLTAAALFYPIVLPPEAPRLPQPPAGLERFRDSVRDRRGWQWVEEMFRRHRKRSAKPAGAPQAAAT